MVNWTPIRKVVVGLVASALAWAAMRLGVDLGPDAVNEAATALVGAVAAYAAKDPRVKSVVDTLDDAGQ